MSNAETTTSRQPLFQMRIEPGLLKKIRARANQERRSMSELVRHAVVLELRRRKST